MLNALLIDPIDYDLGHMRVLNELLRVGVAEFGPEYLERVNRSVAAQRGLGFRLVEDCLIRPSQDIGGIAARHVARLRRGPSSSWIGSMALRTLTRGSPEDEADLMSYLLFDGEFASELIALGMHDAGEAESDLVRFFEE